MDTNEMKNNLPLKAGEGEIVLYQPNESMRLEVRIEDETVWLTTMQMAELFAREDSNIRRHIINIFGDGELLKENNVHFLHVNGVKKPVPFYSLDVIISVGYRVHSPQGIAFRQWATNILKQYLLRGYAMRQQMTQLEERIDRRLIRQHNEIQQIRQVQYQQQQQLDFFIRTSAPPAEMLFFNGEFFTARVAIETLIKAAARRAIIIDHYVDAKTFDMFDVRRSDVKGIIYTQGVGPGMRRLQEEHNRQQGIQPVEIFKWRVEPHDRFIIIDDTLYHCGHSLNATGEKMSAIMRMGASPETVLNEMI